jgi:1-acyl-sn-glycerol-3-phosphate acyltransferase
MAQSTTTRTNLIDWVVTLPYTLIFFGILCCFHPLSLLAAAVSRGCHKRVLDLMNLCIISNIRFTAGTRYRVIGKPALPQGRPVIIVSNHQSMYDIPMVMWECRTREVGYIAKVELGRWIPSISLALRRLGSVLIDRGDTAKAIRSIEEFGRTKQVANQVAAIFPEGTRARDGAIKRFKQSGLKALLRSMPRALLQPVAIRGNWELLRHNFLPVPWGTSVEIEFLTPIEPNGRPIDQLAQELEQVIVNSVGRG